MKKSVVSVSVLLFAACFVAGGQGFSLGDIWRRLCAPNPSLDSTRIFQPVKGWGAGISYGLVGEQVRIVSDGDLSLTEDATHVRYTTDLFLKNEATHSIGYYGRYGPIQLGLNHEIGLKEGHHKSFNFKWLGNFFCLDARYVTYRSMLDGTISVDLINYPDPNLTGNKGSAAVEPGTLATMSTVVINGIYAFNRKHFAYRSAYNGRVVQRRSAGSFLVAAKYMYGNFEIDDSNPVLMNLITGLGRYETRQFSLGAGYSFNWVPYHRDAVSPRDLRGLRNLTFNVTAIPMLTLVNALTTYQYAFQGTFQKKDDMTTYRTFGRIQPNFTARASICYNTGRFYVNVWADYTRFVFQNTPRSFSSEIGNMTLTQNGEFSSWMVTLQLNYRF